MCLAIPAEVVEILEGEKVIVDIGGVRKPISTALLDEVKIGDYVIVHVGFALSRIDPEEAKKTLRLFAEAAEIPDDNGESPLPERFSRGVVLLHR